MNASKRASQPRQRVTIRQARLRDLEILVRHRRGMWRDVGIKTKSALDEADRAYRK